MDTGYTVKALLTAMLTFDLVRRVFANGPVNRGSILGHVIAKTLKMERDTSLLNTQ